MVLIRSPCIWLVANFVFYTRQTFPRVAIGEEAVGSRGPLRDRCWRAGEQARSIGAWPAYGGDAGACCQERDVAWEVL